MRLLFFVRREFVLKPSLLATYGGRRPWRQNHPPLPVSVRLRRPCLRANRGNHFSWQVREEFPNWTSPGIILCDAQEGTRAPRDLPHPR